VKFFGALRAGFQVVALSAAVAALSCGARTELETVERCEDGEPARPCRNACGEGMSECRDGYFHECEVPRKTVRCENACGIGEQSCVGGAWQSCEVPRRAVECCSVCGCGEEVCENGVQRACNAPLPKPPKLRGTIRDFSSSHPDFELPLFGDQSEYGIVGLELGPDDKPVYLGGRNITTSGAASFDQWYRDVPGVNESKAMELELQELTGEPGMFAYDDQTFFPIDGELLGNERRFHNFHFTFEATTTFKYIGGEVFRFEGDDDMWVFINRRLAIDLGGIHGRKPARVSLDERAGALGLELGGTYSLHFFFAERHTDASTFTIETTIAEPGSCE
jgi:fibro-slime domain-containing protein